MTKSNLGRKRLIYPAAFGPVSVEFRVGIKGRNLETGAEADAIEEYCLLTCPPWLAQPASFYAPGPYSGTGIANNELDTSASISKKAPHRLACRPLLKRHFISYVFLFSSD